MTELLSTDPTTEYLPGLGVLDYQRMMQRRHPAVAGLIDQDRLAEAAAAAWTVQGNEFDDDVSGRGSSYRRAQRHKHARAVGIGQLLAMLGGPSAAGLGTVLDVLGGDGLLSRVWRDLAGAVHSAPVPLITGDISDRMVAAALADGLPGIRQPADRLLLRAASVNGVLLAYGTHHVPRDRRPDVLAEARRVLVPGGRVVLHDFAEGSPVDRWFSDVVDPWSKAGHRYDHYTAEEMAAYLSGAGFCEVRVGLMYDPIVLTGATADEAMLALVGYMAAMYGVDLPDLGQTLRQVFRYGPDELPQDQPEAVGEVTVRPDAGGFRAELPRVALVAQGRTPDPA